MNDLYFSSVDGRRESERDLPKWLRGVRVRRSRAIRPGDELRPDLLLLGRFAGGFDVARPGVVPEAHLERPGECARAEPVGFAVAVNDGDVAVRVPEIHRVPERDLHSFTPGQTYRLGTSAFAWAFEVSL